MKKLVIIPAFNESASIERAVDDIRQNAPGFDYIVINDCSTDDTLEVCRKNGIKHVNLSVNLGIGGAVQTGYLYGCQNGYDLAVQFDGDGQHDADVGLGQQLADERRRESFGQVEHRDVQRPLSGRNAQQIGDVGLESAPRREDESRASEGDHDARDNDENVTHAHLIRVLSGFAHFLPP